MKLTLNILISLASGLIAFFTAIFLTIIIVGAIVRPHERDLGLGIVVTGLGLPIWLLTAIAVALFVFARLRKRKQSGVQAN